MVGESDAQTQDLITKWYNRAQIDYSDLYMRLYVAYNAWFRKVTKTNTDREAIAKLKRRFVMWDDYLNDRVLLGLKPLVTQALGDPHDWRGLIDFWYQVRCDLFHGSLAPGEDKVKLAYDSLNLFMSEIITRMAACFTDEDNRRLYEIRILLSTNSEDAQLKDLQTTLHNKFINSSDLWEVDMQRV